MYINVIIFNSFVTSTCFETESSSSGRRTYITVTVGCVLQAEITKGFYAKISKCKLFGLFKHMDMNIKLFKHIDMNIKLFKHIDMNIKLLNISI